MVQHNNRDGNLSLCSLLPIQLRYLLQLPINSYNTQGRRYTNNISFSVVLSRNPHAPAKFLVTPGFSSDTYNSTDTQALRAQLLTRDNALHDQANTRLTAKQSMNNRDYGADVRSTPHILTRTADLQ